MTRPQPGLEGKVVVVAGGSGTVGSGIVYEFLKSGAKVVVPIRGESSLKNLQAELDGVDLKGVLDTFTCVVSDEASCADFAKYISDKYAL
jgi:NAD(P)-dependent dehydrogenase (short-subunit alcohol dehydrogenase family)